MTTHRAVASMAAATIASRLLGFVRIIVIAGVLGTTALGNTFQSTNAISNVLFDLLAAGALSAALVPQLVHAMARSDAELKKMVSSLVALVLIILGTVSIIGVLFAQPLSEWLFSRAPDGTRDAQVRTGAILLRFFIPQVILYGFGAVAIAVLTAKKKFITTVIAPMGSSMFIMATIIVFSFARNTSGVAMPLRDTIILGIAGTGSCLAFVAIPVVVAMRNGISFLPSKDLKSGLSVLSSSVWAIAIQASAALLLGATLLMGNQREGAVVAYQLAFVFFLAPYAILSQSFATVLLPDLSSSALKENVNTQFRDIVSNMMTWTYRPMVVVTGVCVALYGPIINIVAQGQAKSGQDMVEVVFVVLVLGIMPYSVFQATSRIYFAKSNIRLPALTILISSIVMSGAALIGSRHVSGLNLLVVMGLAHTMAYLVASLVLLIMLQREKYHVWPDRTSWMVILGSALYAGVGFVVSKNIIVRGRLLSLAYCGGYVVLSALIIFIVMGSRRRLQLKNVIADMTRRNKVNDEVKLRTQ